ncbi:cytidylyltransferase domain-containing protein [Marinisporobacter balticus]|uniref:Spore coat polysaccharide biosynthesis protein SpsF n=1 Tax=Marinisporobacter balticus TaxID=2018667 RepID=A0A4R2L3E9_9FIRM|nr:3-deoxy-manno-octulosonate cytidylyltransferase [Marinisporobacter balticus]TCO73645.1 spore coat polysaccharide biosynthesis protein SpsF [Marinisporobacter balticus]
MKIGFLITARLKSSRLPFKVLLDLNGKTVIERIIDRVKEIKDISEIILCTSTNPQDKPLIDIAKKNNIYYFNGSEDDVLQRLLDASKLFGLDYFVGITADNPLLTIQYSNLIVDEIKRGKYDFIKIKGMPLGCATYGMNVKALETICKIKNIVDTEIWGRLIDRPEIFNIHTIHVKDKLNWPELRFTLDYKEDYEFINHLYSNVKFKKVLNLYNAIDYLKNNPNTLKINSKCIQLDISEDIRNKIDSMYTSNIQKIIEIKDKTYNQ